MSGVAEVTEQGAVPADRVDAKEPIYIPVYEQDVAGGLNSHPSRFGFGRDDALSGVGEVTEQGAVPADRVDAKEPAQKEYLVNTEDQDVAGGLDSHLTE